MHPLHGKQYGSSSSANRAINKALAKDDTLYFVINTIDEGCVEIEQIEKNYIILWRNERGGNWNILTTDLYPKPFVLEHINFLSNPLHTGNREYAYTRINPIQVPD